MSPDRGKKTRRDFVMGVSTPGAAALPPLGGFPRRKLAWTGAAFENACPRRSS